jgi:hypothetical protein
MEPIRNRSGKVVAWMGANKTIYTLSGRPVGRLNVTAFHQFSGSYIGTYSNGFFRDRRGHAVAFTSGARGGPLPPLGALAPIPPIPHLAPIPSIPVIPQSPRFQA